MLAYDLYLRNKDSKANVVRTQDKPIKKIYVQDGNTITIDSKTLEDYASTISDRYRILQESLIMPLLTSNKSLLNLPNFNLKSTNQPSPYVRIFGNLRKGKSDLIAQLTIQTNSKDKENKLEANYDVLKGTISIKAEKDIPLRIDRENYFFVNRERKVNVFERYVESGILTRKGFFSKDLFTIVANNFFEFVKESNLKERNLDIRGNTSFEIYLLPSKSKIEYHNKKESKEIKEVGFIDSFGNSVTRYASDR